MYVNDEQFGFIVDYDHLREAITPIYDYFFPEYNLLRSAELSVEAAQRDPSYATSIGASGLSYSVLIAAGEHELAESLKGNIFTLGWTEEHTGSDLLSLRTKATPLPDSEDGRDYHITGSKWIINCSYHADYHIALAKVDTEQDGPRSLSFFLIPKSSIKNWQRIETHVMRKMVLGKFEIDGPGRLIGKVGHGLSYLQQMAMPSKYQCTYMGISMLYRSIPAALDHLGTKVIFKDNPLRFSNVMRQMYDVVLKGAFYDFIYHRAVVFNGDGFLQFHGTLLKSFLLLRIHEVLDKNLLITGSKGFTRESCIGEDAADSSLLPVFDGHYTINTLMSAKHMPRYLNAENTVDMETRLQTLRENLFVQQYKNEIHNSPKDIRKPPFFDYADYLSQFQVPFEIDPSVIVNTVQSVIDEIKDRGLSGDQEYKYKSGDMLHWMESVLAAAEMWKLLGDEYVNVIPLQYNGLVNVVNEIIAEGGMTTEFLTPVRMKPIPHPNELDDPAGYLRDLLNIRSRVNQPVLSY
ncbi:MAG: acyl-CoA dehydrogenase family protein [Anaerolineales bacterium]